MGHMHVPCDYCRQGCQRCVNVEPALIKPKLGEGRWRDNMTGFVALILRGE